MKVTMTNCPMGADENGCINLDDAAEVAPATERPDDPPLWSDPDTWPDGKPAEGDTVTIEEGTEH